MANRCLRLAITKLGLQELKNCFNTGLVSPLGHAGLTAQDAFGSFHSCPRILVMCDVPKDCGISAFQGWREQGSATSSLHSCAKLHGMKPYLAQRAIACRRNVGARSFEMRMNASSAQCRSVVSSGNLWVATERGMSERRTRKPMTEHLQRTNIALDLF